MGFQFPIPGLATLLAMISAVEISRIRNVAHFSASDVELVAITLFSEKCIEYKITWVSDQIVYWISQNFCARLYT